MTTDRPLFSIVTITKNNVRGLSSTCDSLLMQSFNDYEWIIVDGDSTDGTILFLSKDGFLKNCVSEPDLGIYDAMNKGIARAKGNYILFLNAGDRLSDADILSTLARTIVMEEPDFLYGDALETGGYYKKARSPENMDWGMFTHHQAMLYQKDAIGTLRYSTDYKIAGDYAFTREFLRNSKTVSYIPAAICIFETGGVSQKNMRLGRIEQYKARQKAGCAFLKNVFVYGVQTLSATLKTFAPRLYYTLWSKISCFRRSDALCVRTASTTKAPPATASPTAAPLNPAARKPTEP